MGYRKLNLNSSQRKAVLRSLTTGLLRNGSITTTEPKAKELKRIADKMITLGKKGDLASRRRALAYITDETVVTNLFEEIAPRFEERQGGYTRLLKLGPRRGDGALMVVVELVE